MQYRSLTLKKAISSSDSGLCIPEMEGCVNLLVSQLIDRRSQSALKTKGDGYCNPPFLDATSSRFAFIIGIFNSFTPLAISSI